MRLAAGVLVEVNDEWLLMHDYISQASMALLGADAHGPSARLGADQPALQEGALADAGKSTT